MSDFLQPDRSPLPRAKDGDRKKVLVVDDDLPLRGMLSAALRQGGYQVLLAGLRYGFQAD